MKMLLTIAAVAEGATGLALLAYPPLVIQLLFGAEITGAGILACRVGGISLIALAVACWPSGAMTRAFYAMLIYNALVALYFAYLGFGGTWVGILLWPAVAAHAILTALLIQAWLKGRESFVSGRVR
jgi:hypothetical protein